MFKGKGINYHTTVTVSKKEEILIWVLSLLYIAWFILSMFLIESVWLIVLLDFALFGVMFTIFIAIIFSPKHKEERLENERITKF